MIPKIIHYCWFGRNPKPKLAEKCIKSWRKYLKDYDIKEWNESNYDISVAPLYVRQAYEAKKWAFVTDYVRLQVVYEQGGIYFDTDVELLKPLDTLLQYGAYFGLGESKCVNTGLGFGAEKGLPLLKDLMDDYSGISFLKGDGGYDTTPCPRRNTEVFIRHGLEMKDRKQIIDGNVLILPMIYLCPIDFTTKKRSYSPRSISIHHFAASWYSEEQRKEIVKQQRMIHRHELIHIPNRFMIRLLGKERYSSFKRLFGK